MTAIVNSKIQPLKIIELDRKCDSEILKQNNLIDCSFEELGKWSEIEHDLLNELIASYQKNRGYEDTLFKEQFKRKIFIRRKTLEKNIAIRRKTNKEIFDFLKKMRDTSFTIKNIYQSNGYKTTAAISFFDKVFLHEKLGKESYFEIEYSELFAMLCDKAYSLKYGNYTKLNLVQIVQLNSKYAKALYELLEANRYKKNFTLKEHELRAYMKFDSRKYYFSYLVREIERAYKIVFSKTNFKYSINSNEKSISFVIL